MTIRVGKYDFSIRKGDTLRIPILFGGTGFEPVDITGWDADLVAKDMTTGEVILSLSTGDGSIIIDGPNLTATLYLDDAATDALTFERAVHTFALRDTPGSGDRNTYLTGTIDVPDNC